MAMVCSNERYIVAWMGNENEFYRKTANLTLQMVADNSMTDFPLHLQQLVTACCEVQVLYNITTGITFRTNQHMLYVPQH